MILIVSVISIILLLYYILKSHYEHWEKRGVPGPKPTYIFGNLGEGFMLKKSVFEIYGDIYKKYKKYPFVGFFKATIPTILVCDPELAKEVLVKSFRNFHDNDYEANKKIDPILARNPFVLRGAEWKIVRSQVTSGLTVGKMKQMYPILQDSCEKMTNFLDAQVNTTNGKTFEAKELAGRFTINIVASCAFGIDAKGFEDKDNEFKQIARDFFKSGFLPGLLFTISFVFPQLIKLLRLKVVNKEAEEKLIDVITHTLKYREENNVVRHDFLHILKEVRKSIDGKFTDIDIIAQANSFFADGYETTSSGMSYVLYRLASNPEVQNKLRDEIRKNVEENGEISYEVLKQLPFLDAVISESLRLEVPFFAFTKICTEPYTYTPKEGDGFTKPVVIEKGTPVVIPAGAFHRDPQYFEDPDTFNPERFMGENKESIPKSAYLPFGSGPRTCLGRRFALLQTKIGVACIIKNFELTLNKKTIVPLQYDPKLVVLTPKGGIWIDIKKVKQ